MPTLRSQTASALTKGKNPSDISELAQASMYAEATEMPNPSPLCHGPGTPAQEHESARAALPYVTPVIRRSCRLKVEADIAAAAVTHADDALGTCGGRKGKSKRGVFASPTVEDGGRSTSVHEAVDMPVDQNKGKGKAEEKITLVSVSSVNAKSGESSRKMIDSDSQVSRHEIALNPSPGFVTTRRPKRACDQESFATSSTKRGRGRYRSEGLETTTMDGEIIPDHIGGGEPKLPLGFDLNQSPGGSTCFDEGQDEPDIHSQAEAGQVAELLEETGAHQLMDDCDGNAPVDLSVGEAGPSHRLPAVSRVPNHDDRPLGRRNQAEASRARFLQIARERAFHFAHFDADGDQAPAGAPRPHAVPAATGRRRGRQLGHVNQDRPEPQLQASQLDWPGPFSTARQLVNNRAMAAAARQSADPPGNRVPLIDWSPTRVSGDPTFSRRKRPSLQDLCLGVLSNNAENVVSLEGVPELVRLQISSAFCERRKMNFKALSLFFQGEPSELQSLDCTQISEEQLTEMMKQICPSHLEKLHLSNCGRALSEQCLLATVASPSTVTSLKSVSFIGAYRLSDRGLEALLLASPQLVHLDLSTCSFLSDASVKAIARYVGGSLESLVLDGCPSLDAKVFVHELVKMQKLRKLSLSEVRGVTDDVVSEICVQLGSHLRELVLARCLSLTDAAIAAIGPLCPSLQVLNLAHLSLLTDVAIAHITDNLRKIQDLNVRRCKFSDEAIATFVTASGGALRSLSLNNVQQVANQTIFALARHSHTSLECLDLSFCRLVDDECLGFLADTCLKLHELKLYGCTQVTDKFLNGHSNCNLKVVF
eukprot:c13446_g1_i1 orf=355-2820(-)